MKMLVYMLDLKDESVIEKYEARHANIDPAIPRKLKSQGVLQNRVCRLGTRLVNILIVTDDYMTDEFPPTSSDPACDAWETEMAEMQVPAPGAKEGEWWALTNVVYLFDQMNLK